MFNRSTLSCRYGVCSTTLREDSFWFYNISWANSTVGSEAAVGTRNWEALLLLLVVFAGVLGNVLVCVAISVEKKLQNITNYFLMSLAVADLFVSLLVMPCSIVSEFMGYWPFGLVMCDLWQVADVMMCTSSIMHMCTISLDRYMGIREPLKMRNKSRTVVAVKMGIVWLLSFLIASPLIILGIFKPEDILSEDLQCGIFNIHFLIYGSLTAFFIPLLIMLVCYSLTIHILYRQAQKCADKKSNAGMRRSTVRRRPKKKAEKESPPTPHQCQAVVSTHNKGVRTSVVTANDPAVKVLGTMFAIFVLSWGPFFSLNLANGICEICQIEEIVFKVFLWLGYLSSTLNPIIYTIFNRKFKRTFQAILTCKLCPPFRCHCDCERPVRKLSQSFHLNGINRGPSVGLHRHYRYSTSFLDSLDESKV
ncbi:hypothetical protein CAPTEDRAFT_141683 [Capitella teleta]|uniref:G-protein coupled receptors family 1 profile domain-containing protein n=1 Tax=Capitella teleta TaxID=283909 RepID=R7VFU5_CAPTE|nr:hypothetical protein CAPTEDRAFT_141683 [Capitella teleta]|eukprot:ELU17504.1 hypothetical protein CAPTEDRAFT_141683 [Capitella teleta]